MLVNAWTTALNLYVEPDDGNITKIFKNSVFLIDETQFWEW